MELFKEQKLAIEAIESFLKTSGDRIFILTGYAGTGKTTLIRPIIDIAEKENYVISLMAPTGRAARILESKTGHEASTIHRAIYRLSGLELPTDEEISGENIEDIELVFYFPIKDRDNTGKELFIVDEASMISSRYSSHELFKFGSGVLINDLLEYSLKNEESRILFIGDPAQLPPVGDNCSCALDPHFFEDSGLTVRNFCLSTVIRQDKDSMILSNAMMIRDLLLEKQRNNFTFKEKDGEFESIEHNMVARSYCSRYSPGTYSSVVITFANSTALIYNLSIRKLLYGTENVLEKNEKVIIVQNNYSYPQRDMMNGDIATVLSINGDPETRKIPVWTENGHERNKEVIELTYRDVELQFDDGISIKCKVLENLLHDKNANLTVNQVKAMFIDFCIRHPDIPKSSQEFKDALAADPYYNAVKIKYGYSITGHKAQGGEWDSVYIDFKMRDNLSDDVLRWDYTAITRAKKIVYAVNPPDIDIFSKLKVCQINHVKRIPDEAFSYSSTHSGISPIDNLTYSLKEKLKGTHYQIVNCENKQYRACYFISNGTDTMRFDVTYTSKWVFSDVKFASFENSKGTVSSSEISEIQELLNGESQPKNSGNFYEPGNEMAKELHDRIMEVCASVNMTCIKVVEHLKDYKIDYYFKHNGKIFFMYFYFNSDGMFTSVHPFVKEPETEHYMIEFINTFMETVKNG